MEFDDAPKVEAPALTPAQEIEARLCAEQIGRWSKYAEHMKRIHDHIVEMAPGINSMERRAEWYAQQLDQALMAVDHLNKGRDRKTVGEPPLLTHPLTMWVRDERPGTSYGCYLLVLLGQQPTVAASLLPTYPQYMGGYEIRYGRYVSFTKTLHGTGSPETGLIRAMEWVQERIEAILVERG